MSGTRTAVMLGVYNELSLAVSGFFAGMFTVRPGNIHSSEDVEIDITRDGEEVAIVVNGPDGYRLNSDDIYTNKSFKPPVFKEAWTVNSWSLLKRQAGENPFADAPLRAKLTNRVFRGAAKVEQKIRRSVEWQAAQVLQTGKIKFTDEANKTLYELDFQAKPTHFPTVSVAWSDKANADPLADLASIISVVRKDGKRKVDTVIMGSNAIENFLGNEKVMKYFDNRRIDRGTIAPSTSLGEDSAEYRGTIEVGSYKLDLWTYADTYKDPVTGDTKEYLDPDNVVVRASSGRLDGTFGAVPNIGALLGANSRARVLPELPSRLSDSANGMDLHFNAWLDESGENLFAGVASRPLMVPTAIDTFGCLKTKL